MKEIEKTSRDPPTQAPANFGRLSKTRTFAHRFCSFSIPNPAPRTPSKGDGENEKRNSRNQTFKDQTLQNFHPLSGHEKAQLGSRL